MAQPSRPAPARGPSPSRRRADPVLAGLLAATGATAGWLALDLADRAAQVLGAWIFVAAVHVALIAVARPISRRPDLPDTTRRFWRAVVVAGVIYLAGDLTQVVVAAVRPFAGDAAAGAAGQLISLSAGSAWLALALLMAPLGLKSAREGIRFWLDVATVLVAAAVFGWYYLVPDVEVGGSAFLESAGDVLRGPVLLLLCVFVIAKLMMSGTAPFTRWCGLVGTAAAAAKGAADAIGSGQVGEGRLHWFLALLITSHALLTVAVRVNHVQLAADPGVLSARPRRPYSLLPYAAVAATYALLIAVSWNGDARDGRAALLGAAVSTALVVARQLAAFHDNARLLGDLDANVTELHEAQRYLHRSLRERDALAAELRHLAYHDNNQCGVCVMRIGSILGVLVLIWLIIGAVAAGQRGYLGGEDATCAKAGTIAVTVVAGPLNYAGANPKIECDLPEPSR